jgi:hypothetical protein
MQQIIIFFLHFHLKHNMFRPQMAIFRCLNMPKLLHCINVR